MDNHLDVFPTSKSVAKYLDWFVSFRSELRERLKVCMERNCPVVTSSSKARPFIVTEGGEVKASEPLCVFCSRIEILERKPAETPVSGEKIDWKKRDGVYPKLWSERIA